MLSENRLAVIGGLYLHPFGFPLTSNFIEICDISTGTCEQASVTLPEDKNSHSCQAIHEDNDGIADKVVIVGYTANAYEWTPEAGGFVKIDDFPQESSSPINGAFVPWPSRLVQHIPW